jgi:hypothetical protein
LPGDGLLPQAGFALGHLGGTGGARCGQRKHHRDDGTSDRRFHWDPLRVIECRSSMRKFSAQSAICVKKAPDAGHSLETKPD